MVFNWGATVIGIGLALLRLFMMKFTMTNLMGSLLLAPIPAFLAAVTSGYIIGIIGTEKYQVD